MNDRVMQFRIGVFVIFAGLVLAMMLIWFGERPTLFRDQGYVVARYDEAPGVNVGIPVRKSGIRIGEVTAIEFDEREGQPDGVLVTLALDRKIKLKAGSAPRIGRALIGDVSIDMTPGSGTAFMELSPNPKAAMNPAKMIVGEVSPDPSKALAAATVAFEKVGPTLDAIKIAAGGIADLSTSAKDVQPFLDTWKATGVKVGNAAEGIDRVIQMNEAELKPAIASLRSVSDKLNGTLDPKTLDDIRVAITRFSSAAGKLDQSLADIGPLLADLGAASNSRPITNFGQTIYRVNRLAYDLSLLTAALNDNGKLSTTGTLQRLVTNAELYENMNQMIAAGKEVMISAKPAVNSLRAFADKVARDPSLIARGALQK